MERKEVLGRLNQYKNTEAHTVLRLLLAMDLDLQRAQNDQANKEDVLKNQGAIRYIKKLLKQTGEYDEDKKPTVYDGGFGD